MKKLILVIAAGISLTACQKERVNKMISGKWEFVVFVGYGNFDPPLPPGNGRIIEFGRDGSFKRFAHDTLLFKGNYSITPQKNCFPNRVSPFLKTSDPSFYNESVINVQGDSLFLSTSSCLIDGGASIYRKIK